MAWLQALQLAILKAGRQRHRTMADFQKKRMPLRNGCLHHAAARGSYRIMQASEPKYFSSNGNAQQAAFSDAGW